MAVSVAVVGATGAVGEIMRQVLGERNFPLRSIKFLASERSAGKTLEFRGKKYTIEPISPQAFAGVAIVLSSTPASVSRESSPMAAKAGAIVIDNSSAWRMDPQVPLVVPEVNAEALRSIPKGIVANPNCSTIQMVVALKPLHDLARIKRVVVSTYQASSGKGAKGMFELDEQLAALGRGEKMPAATAHAAQIAGNVLPHDWKLGEDGYSEEEIKMIKETKKIMGDDSIAVSPTTARVPVRIGHSESINLEFERPITVDQARAALRKAPGVILLDDYAKGEVPLALQCEGRDETFVGRIRKDPTVPHGLNLWVVADNLRKGAATNAVQIAEVLVERGWLPRHAQRAMRNIKLTLSYDGSDFLGWQTQPGVRTVQETVEQAIAKLTGAERVRLNASGRTDTGVHAVAQVANFHTDSRLEDAVFVSALNAHLPDDVVIKSAKEVSATFDANRDALRKLYRYVIEDSPVPNPCLRRYVCRSKRALDAATMARAAEPLRGRHDFHSFETAWPNRATSVRTILHLSVSRCGPFVWIDVEADGFLYNMVRAIAGTLMNVGRGYWPESKVAEILEAQDRTQAGPTAPAQGLFLMRVSYD